MEICELIFITHLCSTDVASSLCRLPAGFYVSLETDGNIAKTSNKPTSTCKDEVVWDEKILLSLNRTSIISFKVFASFELGPMLGSGELLREFRISVGEVLDQNEQHEPIIFHASRDEVLPSCSSLSITTKRGTYDASKTTTKPDLSESDCQLEQITDEGHDAIRRYFQSPNSTDLRQAISCFQRAHDRCPPGHSHRSSVLFNLASAELIRCQAEDDLNLDVPITHYRDALRLRPGSHPDHSMTMLALSSALLALFQNRGDKADRAEATELLVQVVQFSSVESYAHKEGELLLKMVEDTAPAQTMRLETAEADHASSMDSIHVGRSILLTMSQWDLHRPVMLSGLGNLLYRRFQENDNLVDLHEAVSLLEYAVQLASSRHPSKPGWINVLGDSLLSRFQYLGHVTDVDKSVSRFEEAVGLSPDDHPDMPMLLYNLARSLSCRFVRLKDPTDIDWSVSALEQAIQVAPGGHPHMLVLLNGLGNSLSLRSEDLRVHNPADINKTIQTREKALQLTPDNNPYKPLWLNDLGISLIRRFECLGDLTDVDKSISASEEAIRLIPDGHPHAPMLLKNLGITFSRRFEKLGELADVHKSISLMEQAVHLTPVSHPDMALLCGSLGSLLFCRFERLGDLADISQSISMLEEATALSDDGHPEKLRWLNELGNSLSSRFERLGDLSDINRSISINEMVLRLKAAGHQDKLPVLKSLGISLFHRYERLGDTVDMDRSLSICEETLCLTPDGHADRPATLNSLGLLLSRRFQRFGDIADIDKSISMMEESVCLTPDGHSNKPTYLNTLGSSLLCHFERVRDITSITRSISMLEEAVRLTPDGHPHQPCHLRNLGSSLLNRFECFGDVMDINNSILMIQKAASLTPDDHPLKPIMLRSCGNSLTRRYERFGDTVDITKSISMYEKALSLTPDDHPDRPGQLGCLGKSLSHRFEHLGDFADVSKSISVIEEAVRLTPDHHPEKPSWLNNLGGSLSRRFQRLNDLADINKSIAMFEEALRLSPDKHPEKSSQFSNLGNALSHRFERLGNLADINRSIAMIEEALSLTPDNNLDKPAWLQNLGSAFLRRVEHLDDLTDINKCISTFEEAVRLTPVGHPDKPGRISNLGSSFLRRFLHLQDITDIDKSISMNEEAICLIPNGHPQMPALLNNAGNSYFCRFDHLGDMKDSEKAISMLKEAVHLTPNDHPDRLRWMINLGDAFMAHFKHLRDPHDLLAATSHFSLASRASSGLTLIRFNATLRWISSAQVEGNSQALLDAYTTATIGLLPQLAWLGLPLTERHRLLIIAADIARDGAAAALEAGFPGMAVEWLEQGRSIVWGQFLQLRTPIDDLRDKHPTLADEFEMVSRQLEHVSSQDDIVHPLTNTRSLEDEVQRHHGLALRREKLLDDIRSLPDFDRFLLPRTVEQLAGLASSGPVVYLNASKQRCDALIVLAERGSVIPVPLSSTSYQDVEEKLCLLLNRTHPVISRDDVTSEGESTTSHLVDVSPAGDLVEDGDREGGLRESEEYTPDDRFRRVLAFLWRKVANPVLTSLGISTPPLKAEKMTRIFWCPTGSFSFLPIHAAGLYSTAQAGEKLSDFAISSYIPTLSAFIPSTEKHELPRNHIYLVAVPQPPSDGQFRLRGVAEEIDYIKTLSSKSQFVSPYDSDATVEDVMAKMAVADWVHFACHGVQDPENPLNSGLCLADRRRLRLSDIIRLSRPQGGLAFLSACQTAQGDEKLSEESVHLAAGMLLAGYGSVIATMWAIMDRDAPRVTKDVYSHLFRDSRVPDSTEAAEALHYATLRLRDFGASFASWVPFIHIGR